MPPSPFPDPLHGEPLSSQHSDIQDEYADYHHDAQITSPLLPAEIPDSQEDRLPNLDLEDLVIPDSQGDRLQYLDPEDIEFPDGQEDRLQYSGPENTDIPDAQDDFAAADLAASELDGSSSVDTEIISGGTKLTPKPKYRYVSPLMLIPIEEVL